jgi:predicted metal-dependent hydrolase
MEIERSEVRWGTRTIAYRVERSARRATVAIAVEPSGDVVLRAPRATPLPRLDRVVRDKARWIVERVRQKSDLPPPLEREFVSGEPVLYLGRHYRLRVAGGSKAEPARLERGHLVVVAGGSVEERRESVRRAVVRWYRTHAAERFAALVPTWAARLRIAEPGVLVRDQRRRWGSCDPGGTVRLSWRIVQAAPRLVDYVIAHELVHLRHAHHGADFWAALGRAMPDYERRRDELRRIGPALVW